MKTDKLTLKTSILKQIFEIAPERFQEKDLNDHPLTKKLCISGKELKNNIDFLVEIGLIQRFPGASYKKDRIFEWLLTEKGLDYLETKAIEEKQNRFNQNMVYLTKWIAVAAIINASFFVANFILLFKLK